jgi:hypothetical protein
VPGGFDLIHQLREELRHLRLKLGVKRKGRGHEDDAFLFRKVLPQGKHVFAFAARAVEQQEHRKLGRITKRCGVKTKYW